MVAANAKEAALLPGFTDPVHDAQSVFSHIMDAMARPGRIHTPEIEATGPAPLNPMAAQALLTLADHDTPVWLDSQAKASAPVANWLRFHGGTPIADDPRSAHFALVTNPGHMPPLTAFASGEPEFPDRSATLLIQVGALKPDGGWQLTGPGIETEHRLGVDGLGSQFVKQWQENRALFPLGVDVIFCAPQAFACLPRTTEIREA